MPNFSALWGAYDVEGSINLLFASAITANGAPAWMPSARIITDMGREGSVLSGYSGHAFALAHLGSQPVMQFEGGTVDNGVGGYMRQGMLQIDCWISKTYAGEGFAARLRIMRDLVSRAIGSGRAVPIYNLYGSTATPVYTTAIARIWPPQFDAPSVDVNPDYLRIRGVANYTWTERNG
jgi:hypothetical protein